MADVWIPAAIVHIKARRPALARFEKQWEQKERFRNSRNEACRQSPILVQIS